MDILAVVTFAVSLCDAHLVHLITDNLLPSIPLNHPLIEPPSPTAKPPANDDAALTFAHHDLWWAKGHAWTVANWAVATLVALAVVDRTKWPPELLSPLSIALTILAFAGNWYLGRTQADMAASRLKAEFHIQRSPGLSNSVGIWSRGLNDFNRNSGFTRALMLLVSSANGLAVYLLNGKAAFSLALICGQFAFGGALQSWQVRRQIISLLRHANAA